MKENTYTGYTEEEIEEMEGMEYESELLSCTYGDFSPSNPWDAPGMCISDFI